MNTTRWLALAIIISLLGCTSLQPIEAAPEELQKRIATGELIQVGDQVKVVTDDGQVHEFLVTAVGKDRIEGKEVSLPLENIVAVQTREFSIGKTAALTGGGIALTYILIILTVAPVLIFAASP